MSERLITARSGASTAYLGTIALHSAYDPVAEADRYAASLELPANCRKVILVEPCLGYLTASIRRLLPEIHIIVVHCSPFFSSLVSVAPADAEWTPAEKEDLTAFLESRIEDREAAAVKVIEWRPAIAAYGTTAREVFRAISDFLRRAAANERTIRAFGRRWLRNAIRNAGNFEKAFLLLGGDAPVVVAGAGPSLEESAEEIARATASFPCFLIAVSSAVPALLERGIMAYLVTASDGGAWAGYHLHEAARAKLPVAAALVADLPSALAARPLLLITDGSAWQRVLIASSGLPFITSPQRGTVSATAIDLALASTTGKVYVAGMDLANSDIKTHARPYALDRFREDDASRLTPEYTAAFERSGAIDSSATLDVYASWFGRRADRYSRRLVTLGPPHPSLSSIPHGDRIDAGGDRRPAPVVPAVRPPALDGDRPRSRSAAAALLAGLEEEGSSGPLARELASLLLREGAEATDVASSSSLVREAVLDAAKGLALGVCHGK